MVCRVINSVDGLTLWTETLEIVDSLLGQKHSNCPCGNSDPAIHSDYSGLSNQATLIRFYW